MTNPEQHRVGPYVLQERLGEGAMGAVFRARHDELQRTVALKVLRPGARLSNPDVTRFAREMRLLSQLRHPNLVMFYDGGRADGIDYIAMELVDGTTLSHELVAGPLPWPVALRLSTGVAAALAHLHQGGLVHRDIKPSNVMITRDGTAKVVDFGLARRADSTQLTPDGSVVGTLRYMAPEALVGAPQSPAADVWALGVLLHETLTGRTLFVATTLEALVDQIVNEPVYSIAESAEVPAAFARLIDSALARDATARPTAAELAAALAHVGDEQATDAPASPRAPAPRPATPPEEPTMTMVRPRVPPPQRGRRTPLAALAVGAVGAALALLALHRDPPPASWSVVPSAAPGPATGLFARWRGHESMISAFAKPGAAESLRSTAGFDLGPSPRYWAHWIQLGRWLASDAQAFPPRAATASAGATEPVQERLILGYFHDLQGRIDPPLLAATICAVTDWPDDGRWWLLLGYVLESESDAAGARRAYRIGLQRWPAMGELKAPRLVWGALARGLAAVEPDRIAEVWLERVRRLRDASQPWHGIVGGLGRTAPELLERVFAAGEADQAQRELAFAEHGRYELNVRRRAPEALRTWERGLALCPGSRHIAEPLVRRLAAAGDIARASTYVALLSDPAAWALKLELMGGNGPACAPHALSLRTDEELVELELTRLVEEGCLEAAEAFVEQAVGVTRLTRGDAPVAAIALAAAGSAKPWVARACLTALTAPRAELALWERAARTLAAPLFERACAEAISARPRDPRPHLARALSRACRGDVEAARAAAREVAPLLTGVKDADRTLLEAALVLQLGRSPPPLPPELARARDASLRRLFDHLAAGRDDDARALAAAACVDSPHEDLFLLAHAHFLARAATPDPVALTRCRAALRARHLAPWPADLPAR